MQQDAADCFRPTKGSLRFCWPVVQIPAELRLDMGRERGFVTGPPYACNGIQQALAQMQRSLAPHLYQCSRVVCRLDLSWQQHTRGA